MTNETAIGGDVSGSVVASGSIPADSSSATATTDTSSADVNLQQSVQGTTGQSQTQEDPLSGLPSQEELTRLVEQGTPYAKALSQLRGAYEPLKTQFTELESKWKPVEPFISQLERFERPEDLQQVVDFREQLYGWENDPQTGQLVPATQRLVQALTQSAPERADFLAADLLNGMTRDPDTGREMTRMDLALEAIAADPARRAAALSILGGVEPTSIAPTWQPSADELEVVRPELQDVYRKLPYDKREGLKLNDPEFINEYLEDQQFKQDTRAREAQRTQQEQQMAVQREQYIHREAENAGNSLVEQQFKEGMQGFATNICEKFQPIKPLDPQSPEAQQMGPEQAVQLNQRIQQTNRGAGVIVSIVTAALAHPETAFLAREFVKDIGITDEMLQKFDSARLEFAAHNRNFGNLRFRAGLGQNGQPGALPQDIGMLQTQAQRAQRALMANGNAIAGPLMSLLSDFFSLQANSHNQTLNGAVQARPSINGTGFDPTSSAAQQRAAPNSEAELRARIRADVERLASRGR